MYELAEKYNLALVFPSAENSFYVDYEASHGKYATLVGVEMVEYMRKTFGLCSNKEDTFISGLSMGGFGALYLGLSYPNTFGKIVALSSALLSHGITGMKPGDDRGIANYYYFRNIFGDLDNLAESDKNPEVLITNLLAQGKELPKMYVACGTEDFLLPANQRFHKFLVENNVDANYVESSGDHDMAYWNEYFAKGFEWCLSE